MARLTKSVVDRVVPEGSWTWLGDEEVPGFGLRVYPSGRKVFHLRYRTRHGRQRMLKLGEYGVLTVQEARGQARKIKVRVLEGRDPIAETDKARRDRTVAEFGEVYLERHAKPRKKTWMKDAQRLRRHVYPRLGNLRLTEVTRADVVSLHSDIGKTTPVEANRVHELVRGLFERAREFGYFPEDSPNPAIRIRRFRERARDRWLDRDEVERLLQATDQEEDPYIRAVVPLLLLTGMRKGELLGARWSDVALDRGEIRLPDTKAGESQVRLLSEPAKRILRELPRQKESDWLFPSPHEPRKPRRYIQKPWERIRKRAEVENVTLHDLRRTAGSWMIQKGVPIEVVQQLLGHTRPAVTRRLRTPRSRERAGGTGHSGIVPERHPLRVVLHPQLSPRDGPSRPKAPMKTSTSSAQSTQVLCATRLKTDVGQKAS